MYEPQNPPSHPHSHAPMRGDAPMARLLCHQLQRICPPAQRETVTKAKSHKIKGITTAGIKYQYSLRAITMRTLNYKVLLRKEDDGTYTVIVPSLPGCLTFGRTVEEALANGKRGH